MTNDNIDIYRLEHTYYLFRHEVTGESVWVQEENAVDARKQLRLGNPSFVDDEWHCVGMMEPDDVFVTEFDMDPSIREV